MRAAPRERSRAWPSAPRFLGVAAVFLAAPVVALVIEIREGHPLQVAVEALVVAAVLMGLAWLRRAERARAEAETALRTSEERHRSLVEHASDLIVVLDDRAVVTYVASSSERLFGIGPDELVGRSAIDLVHPDDVPLVKSTFAAGVAQLGKVGGLEVRIRDGAGEWRWAEVRYSNRLGDPSVGGIVLSVRDITDRFAAEWSLREREAQYHSFFVDNRAVMLLLDPVTEEIVDANPAAVAFYGHPLERLVDVRDRRAPGRPGGARAGGDAAGEHRRPALPDLAAPAFERRDPARRCLHGVDPDRRPVARLRDRARRHRAPPGRSSRCSTRSAATARWSNSSRSPRTCCGSIPAIRRASCRSTSDRRSRRCSASRRRSGSGIRRSGPRWCTRTISRRWTGTAPPRAARERRSRPSTGCAGEAGASSGSTNSSVPILDEDGTAVAWQGIYQDVTERKRAEDVLRRQALIFESVHDAVVVIDPRGRVIDANLAAERLTGLAKLELVGGRADALVGTDDTTALRRDIAAGLAEEGRWSGVVASRRPDGSEGFLELEVVPLRDPRGVLIGSVAVGRDITEKRSSDLALHASERRFRAVFDGAAVGIARLSLDGVVLEANDAVAELLGTGRRELLGVHLGTFLAEVGPGEVPEEFARLASGGLDRYEADRDFVRRGGERIWCRVTASLVRDERGRPDVAILMLKDITARKAAEDALAQRAMNDALTGLPNRDLLLDRLGIALARVERGGAGVAVMFLDLDRFKRVNDELGHEAGDRVLREVARRFATSVRPADTVARYGGDEFVVLCQDVWSVPDAVAAAERLTRCLDDPLALPGARRSASASASA